jgi:hypothetical protein
MSRERHSRCRATVIDTLTGDPNFMRAPQVP